MAHLVIAWDGTDSAAPRYRAAASPRHLETSTAGAREGRLAFAGSILAGSGEPAGSLLLLDLPDEAGLDAWIAAEPFVTGCVWERRETWSCRIAPLPYHRPLPGAPGGAEGPVQGVAVKLLDPPGPGALERRLAARPAHFARVRPCAERGELLLGAALLDAPDGRMVGSLVVLALPDADAARAWLAEDPYTQAGVWAEPEIWPFRIAPLPYKALPRG